LVLALLAAGSADATTKSIHHVFGSAGSKMTSASYKLTSTVGQSIVGATSTMSSASYKLAPGFWCAVEATVVGVDPTLPPPVLSFDAPRPNPAFGQVDLSFSIPKESSVDLALFDVRGARVHQLVSGRLEAGPHRRTWDGLSGNRQAGAGVYFAVLTVDGATVGKKSFVLLR
jgi:hypothetical protein